MDTIPALDCPFCDWSDIPRKKNRSQEADNLSVPARRFMRHIGRHLEELCLLVFPWSHAEETDSHASILTGAAIVHDAPTLSAVSTRSWSSAGAARRDTGSAEPEQKATSNSTAQSVLQRTEHAAHQDTLYNPTLVSSTPRVVEQSDAGAAPRYTSSVAERLISANATRRLSPGQNVTRENSPFKQYSPFATTRDRLTAQIVSKGSRSQLHVSALGSKDDEQEVQSGELDTILPIDALLSCDEDGVQDTADKSHVSDGLKTDDRTAPVFTHDAGLGSSYASAYSHVLGRQDGGYYTSDDHNPAVVRNNMQAQLRSAHEYDRSSPVPATFAALAQLHYHRDGAGAVIDSNNLPPADPHRHTGAEKYTVTCVCGFSEDDGNTVACDSCDRWQHILCYYPQYTDGLPIDLSHWCVECRPDTPIDRQATCIRQKEASEQRLAVQNVVERQLEQSHKKVSRASTRSELTNSWPLDEVETTVRLTKTGRVSKAAKGLRVHQCGQCDKVFTRAEGLRRHQQNHKPGAFVCKFQECGRTFHRDDLKLLHQAGHASEDATEQTHIGFTGSADDVPTAARTLLDIGKKQKAFEPLGCSDIPDMVGHRAANVHKDEHPATLGQSLPQSDLDNTDKDSHSFVILSNPKRRSEKDTMRTIRQYVMRDYLRKERGKNVLRSIPLSASAKMQSEEQTKADQRRADGNEQELLVEAAWEQRPLGS